MGHHINGSYCVYIGDNVEDRPYISYPFTSPRMDQSVPSNQVKPGTFGRLSGVDGRFKKVLLSVL